mmetsp:Transcript_14296/g.26773  ORF Transcript_14296/g.26773 Transcript_14296/m.26773 type:complete len:240 (+) Transcript_14296:492-1211(+)
MISARFTLLPPASRARVSSASIRIFSGTSMILLGELWIVAPLPPMIVAAPLVAVTSTLPEPAVTSTLPDVVVMITSPVPVAPRTISAFAAGSMLIFPPLCLVVISTLSSPSISTAPNADWTKTLPPPPAFISTALPVVAVPSTTAIIPSSFAVPTSLVTQTSPSEAKMLISDLLMMLISSVSGPPRVILPLTAGAMLIFPPPSVVVISTPVSALISISPPTDRTKTSPPTALVAFISTV